MSAVCCDSSLKSNVMASRRDVHTTGLEERHTDPSQNQGWFTCYLWFYMLPVLYQCVEWHFICWDLTLIYRTCRGKNYVFNYNFILVSSLLRQSDCWLQNPLCTSPVSNTCHRTCPSNSSLNHLNLIWSGLQIIKPPHHVIFSTPLLPRPTQAQLFLSAPYSWTPSAYAPPSVWQTNFTPIQNNRQNYTSVHLSLYVIQ